MWKTCYKLTISYKGGIVILYDNMQYKKGLKYIKIRKLDDKKNCSTISLETVEDIWCSCNGKKV